jgi:hypothetical protein
MQAEGFTNDGVEEGKILEFVVGEIAEFSRMVGAEVLELFLVECLTARIIT